jgi:hypothetical protein
VKPLGFADHVPAKFNIVKRKSLTFDVDIEQDGSFSGAKPLLFGRFVLVSQGDPRFAPLTPQTLMLSSKLAVPEYLQLMLREDSVLDAIA